MCLVLLQYYREQIHGQPDEVSWNDDMCFTRILSRERLSCTIRKTELILRPEISPENDPNFDVTGEFL